MDYSEFVNEVQFCEEQMSKYQDEIQKADTEIKRIGLSHQLIATIYEFNGKKTYELHLNAIDKQLPYKIDKLRSKEKYEWWKMKLSFLMDEYPEYATNYKKEYSFDIQLTDIQLANINIQQ